MLPTLNKRNRLTQIKDRATDSKAKRKPKIKHLG